MGLVYKSTNKVTGKVYIGRTKHSLDYRKERHLKKAFIKKKENKFYNSLRKYGKKNFIWEILHDDLPWDLSKELETIEIIKHDSFHNGYNMTVGGECGPKPSIAENSENKIKELCNSNIHILEISRILNIKSYNIRRYCIKNNIPYLKISGSVTALTKENEKDITHLVNMGYHYAKIYKELNLPKGPVTRFIKYNLLKIK